MKRNDLRQHILTAIGFAVWIASSALSAPAAAHEYNWQCPGSCVLVSHHSQWKNEITEYDIANQMKEGG